MAFYYLGPRPLEPPSRTQSVLEAAAAGANDITKTLFTIQQLKEKAQSHADNLNQKALSLALGYKQLAQGAQWHRDLLTSREMTRQAATQQAQVHDAAVAKSAVDLETLKSGFAENLARTKSELKAQAPEKKSTRGPNQAEEARALAADLDRLDQGLQPEYVTGMNPDAARQFIKKRLAKLNAVSPIISLMGNMGTSEAAPDMSQGAVPTPAPGGQTKSGTAFKVVSP